MQPRLRQDKGLHPCRACCTPGLLSQPRLLRADTIGVVYPARNTPWSQQQVSASATPCGSEFPSPTRPRISLPDPHPLHETPLLLQTAVVGVGGVMGTFAKG